MLYNAYFRIAYNKERRKIERYTAVIPVCVDILIIYVFSQVPVIDDVRDVTLARSGLYALVSYECQPPQLWKLETYKQRAETTSSSNTQGSPPDLDASVTTSRLSLECTYMPHIPEGFSAPGCFGGTDDELVLCTSKGTFAEVS